VHSASTGKYSLVYVHPKRGREAMDAGRVVPVFTGIAVHDAWAPYDCYPATHASRNAHLVRELIAAAERDSAPVWAQQGIDALLALKDAAERSVAAGAAGIETRVLVEQVGRVRHAALVRVKDHAEHRTTTGKKLHALARRMRDRLDDYLRFARDPWRCPFDNNAGKREIRMVELRQKSPSVCVPSPARSSSAPSVPTLPPPPSTATTNSTS
jgi:hypothetical protein